MSNPPILVTDRIKQVLQDHGVTREMIERRVAEHRPRGRRLSVDLNALTFQPGVVAAMLELVTEPRDASSSAASLWPFRPTYPFTWRVSSNALAHSPGHVRAQPQPSGTLGVNLAGTCRLFLCLIRHQSPSEALEPRIAPRHVPLLGPETRE